MSDAGAVSVSYVFIAYNEERNLGRALESVRETADEIVVLDSGSSDSTVEIATRYGARVFHNKFSDFASQKNLAVSYASCDYIFVMDADEELSDGLKRWMADFRAGRLQPSVYRAAGFFLARKSSFLGRWINHSGWFPDYTLRLVRRGAGEFKKARVHESFEVAGEKLRIDRGCFMWHYTYGSLEQYFDKFNSYTSLAALDLRDRGARRSIVKMAVNPVFSFIKQYFIKLGFLDGFHGFVLAVLSAFYVFVKYCKHYFLPPATTDENKN